MDQGDEASKYLEQVTGGTAKDFSLKELTGGQAEVALMPLVLKLKDLRPFPVGPADNVERLVDRAITLMGGSAASDWTEMSEATKRAFMDRVHLAQWRLADIADKPFIRLPPGISDLQRAAALLRRCAMARLGAPRWL